MTQSPIVPDDGEIPLAQWDSPPPPPTAIQHTVSGFTPLFDHLAREHGLVRAAVYGRIWRYCQMSDRVCNASLETVSRDIGLDRATVQRHAEQLVKDGYLRDLSPSLRNKPHTYADAGKVTMVSTTTAGATVAQCNVTVAQRNVTVAQCNVTVAESQLKKVLKKDFKKEESAAKTAPPHPALLAYRETAKLQVAKGARSVVEAEVGRTDDCIALWRNVVRGWVLVGWNPRNIAGMLDFYRRGEIPTTHKEHPETTGMAAILEYERASQNEK